MNTNEDQAEVLPPSLADIPFTVVTYKAAHVAGITQHTWVYPPHAQASSNQFTNIRDNEEPWQI